MKKIAFIDIHSQSPILGAQSSSHVPGQNEEDRTVIYLFHESSEGYDYEKSLDYTSQTELSEVDEFYVSIPANFFNFRILNLPFSDREKIRKVLPIELDNLVLGGSEEIVFDIIVLGGDDASADVLVVYTEKSALNKILGELAHRNIDPRVVTSIDLQTVGYGLGEFPQNIAEQLLIPPLWHESDRITYAQQEILKPSINLRTGQFAYRKDVEKTAKALKITVALGFLLAFVIHANILFQTVMTKKENADIAKEMRVAYSSIFPGEKKIIDELYQLKSHIREIGEKNDALTGVSALQFLAELSKRMESQVVYNDIQIEKGLVKLKGEARSTDDLTKIRAKLSEFLSDVSVSDVKPTAQGKILFTVVAKGT
jgi:type II secretory pathway component PulL